MRNNDSLDWTNSGAPISQVLNDASSTQHTTEPTPTTHHVSAAPFSGKLVDLLLDTTRDVTYERRRADHQLEEPSRVVSETSVITLPQPAQPSTKATRRQRIPPLLQGLHQPPPLPPTGRLFPPITDGVSGFEQEICERIQSSNTAHKIRNREDEKSLATKSSGANSPHGTRKKITEKERGAVPSTKPIANKDSGKEVDASELSDFATTAQEEHGRKRKRWSDVESQDLLLGVTRFGIGNWKKILQCPDFNFHDRIAVDLKDRFRILRPGVGLTPRRSKRRKQNEDELATPEATTYPVESTNVPSTQTPSRRPLSGKKFLAEGAGGLGPMNHVEMAEPRIPCEFKMSTRRPRHPFSAVDDENLLKAFKKHGTAWRNMCDDKEFGFETRYGMDLRDRFRIRYPEAYEQAGYRPKIKRKNREGTEQGPLPDIGQQSETRETRHSNNKSQDTNENSVEDHHVVRTPGTRSLTHARTSSAPDPGPTLPAFTDEDGITSPVILNRNILQWADTNTASMPATFNGFVLGTYTVRDPSTNTTIPNDGLHVNPLATLNLPAFTSSENANSTFSNTQYQYFTNTSAPPPSAIDPNTLIWPNTTFPKPPTSSSQQNLLRTPNLPTIVFPHVPARSARTTMHNLPRPADLLSGFAAESEEQVAEYGTWGGGASTSGFVM